MKISEKWKGRFIMGDFVAKYAPTYMLLSALIGFGILYHFESGPSRDCDKIYPHAWQIDDHDQCAMDEDEGVRAMEGQFYAILEMSGAAILIPFAFWLAEWYDEHIGAPWRYTGRR